MQAFGCFKHGEVANCPDEKHQTAIHTYTIVDAISDKNVLPFRVDYIRTMREKDNINDEKVRDIDREKALMAPQRIHNNVEYIIKHFSQKTFRNSKPYMMTALSNVFEVASAKDRNKIEEVKEKIRLSGFNSIFAVASIEAAKLYYLEFKKQQKEIDNLKDFIARNKARVATTNLAKDRQKKLDRMDIIEIAREKPKPTFNFNVSRTPAREVITVKDLVIGYDEPLTRPLNFTIERNQKIAIRGVNGLGKSTLLNTILGILNPLSGHVEKGQFVEVGYFKQEEQSGSTTALDEIWNAYPSMTNGEVRAALAKCGLTTNHITSQMRVLSGGENAKVRLCKLMLRDINFLVLDEPTNHLDVDAKDELKKAVREFKGTVLIVSHEPDFYMDIVTDVWNVEDWTTKII